MTSEPQADSEQSGDRRKTQHFSALRVTSSPLVQTFPFERDFVVQRAIQAIKDTVIIGVFAHCAVVFLNVFVLRFLSHRGAETPICEKLPIPVRKLN